MTPPTHLWFQAFASILPDCVSNLFGGVMTPPYEWCVEKRWIQR